MIFHHLLPFVRRHKLDPSSASQCPSYSVRWAAAACCPSGAPSPPSSVTRSSFRTFANRPPRKYQRYGGRRDCLLMLSAYSFHIFSFASHFEFACVDMFANNQSRPSHVRHTCFHASGTHPLHERSSASLRRALRVLCTAPKVGNAIRGHAGRVVGRPVVIAARFGDGDCEPATFIRERSTAAAVSSTRVDRRLNAYIAV
jgi:hypothetical protein